MKSDTYQLKLLWLFILGTFWRRFGCILLKQLVTLLVSHDAHCSLLGRDDTWIVPEGIRLRVADPTESLERVRCTQMSSHAYALTRWLDYLFKIWPFTWSKVCGKACNIHTSVTRFCSKIVTFAKFFKSLAILRAGSVFGNKSDLLLGKF